MEVQVQREVEEKRREMEERMRGDVTRMVDEMVKKEMKETGLKSKEQLRESMEENLCKLKTEIDEEEKLANVRHELKTLEKDFILSSDSSSPSIV